MKDLRKICKFNFSIKITVRLINFDYYKFDMKTRQKNLLGIAGVIGLVFGVFMMVPLTIKANYILASLAALLVIAGIILLSIALGVLQQHV